MLKTRFIYFAPGKIAGNNAGIVDADFLVLAGSAVAEFFLIITGAANAFFGHLADLVVANTVFVNTGAMETGLLIIADIVALIADDAFTVDTEFVGLADFFVTDPVIFYTISFDTSRLILAAIQTTIDFIDICADLAYTDEIIFTNLIETQAVVADTFSIVAEHVVTAWLQAFLLYSDTLAILTFLVICTAQRTFGVFNAFSIDAGLCIAAPLRTIGIFNAFSIDAGLRFRAGIVATIHKSNLLTASIDAFLVFGTGWLTFAG